MQNINAAATVDVTDAFVMVDLGEVYLARAPIGSHLWQGNIEVMSTGSSPAGNLETIAIDQVYVLPVSEGYGAMRADAPDAVLFGERSLEIRFDGVYRESSGGETYSEVGDVIGALPRLPVGGMEARQTEVFLRVSRGTLDGATEDVSSGDSFIAQVVMRPCWLFVPEVAT